ncbi:sialin-like [Tetranychus urticae]|uniref:sialin-like n=1 Tax=Tetranychus urticae TaxID=32264 RepID=UPI00077B8BB0|nr:sialin-like [Tetranychus urticae]
MKKRLSQPDDAIALDPSFIGVSRPFPFPFRYVVMFMIFMCMLVGYSIRNIINVALLAMVNDSPNPSPKTLNNQDVLSSLFAKNQSVTFDWNQNDQALILGGYFYTFTGSLLLGGIITDKLNIIWLLSITQTITAISTLVTPIAASTSVYLLIVARMIIGLMHGVMLPACFNLIEHWFPTGEIAIAQSLMAVGANFGTAISMPVTAWLCSSNLWGGWPSAFIIFGLINSIFVVILFIGISDGPQSNRWISQYEKDYLAQVVVNKGTKRKKIKTPWIKLFTSLPLWAVFWNRGLIGLAYYTVNSKIPVYMEKVLNYKIENNGLLNSLFYVFVCMAQLIAGPASKAIILKGWLSRTVTRKIFESIACLGLASGLMIISFLGNQPTIVVIVLIISMFFYGFDTGGNIPIVPEMAPKYVGTAFGFSNTLISASGFIAPALIGYILGDDTESVSKWNLVFHVVAGLQVVGILIFITFATSEPQAWAAIDDNNDEEDENDRKDVPNQLRA